MKTITKNIYVDSGTVVLCDPCYLNHPGQIDNCFANMEPRPSLVSEPNKQPVPDKVKDDPDIDHESIPRFTGEGMGVFVKPGYGDGSYPCTITINDEGIVTKLEVRFAS